MTRHSAISTGRAPNIVICMCDQLRAFETGCYGHPVVRTPHMDRMSNRGPWLRTACSNSPLCVPARSVLLSGQYARTCTGTSSGFCGFPPSRQRVVCQEPVLPEVLREAGYRTAAVGKWHLHPAPDLLGFEQAVYPHNLHHHIGQTFYDLAGHHTEVGGFSLDFEMDQVRTFLDQQDPSAPFFLYYNLSPPHMPLLDAPERYTRMYHRDEVLLRENVWKDGKLVHDRDWFRSYLWDYRGNLGLYLNQPEVLMTDDYRTRKSLSPTYPVRALVKDVHDLLNDPDLGPAMRKRFPYLDDSILDDFDLRDLTALYYGMTSCVDDYLGQLMEALEERGQAEDTLVVFLSDHGDNLGSHHLWMKDHLYEESTRIPMLFQWGDRLPPGPVEDQVGSIVDLMPTLLGLAGLETPSSCQGANLSPVLKRETAVTGENCAFIETYRQRALGIRTPTRMFGSVMQGASEAQWGPSEKPEEQFAFDLSLDPFQKRNLAVEAATSPEWTALRERLFRWHRETPRRPMPEPTSEIKSLSIY